MKLVKFEGPKDFTPPEGTADDDTFDVAATLKLENGKYCLVKIDGMPMPGYEDDAAKGEKANEGSADAAMQADFAQRYTTAMQGPQPQQ